MLPLLSLKSGAPLSAEHARSSKAWSTSALRPKFSRWNFLGGSCLALSLLSLAYVLFEVMSGSWGSQLQQLHQHIRTTGHSKQSDVLVMYIFSNTDPQYLNNLKFFLREGVHAGDGCEYIFVINRTPDEEVRKFHHQARTSCAIPTESTNLFARTYVRLMLVCSAFDARFHLLLQSLHDYVVCGSRIVATLKVVSISNFYCLRCIFNLCCHNQALLAFS